VFDIISSLNNPSTSEEISLKAKLNERYVREWLGAMVVSRVIEYDSAHKTYWLEKEKMDFLTRASSSYNFAPEHRAHITLQLLCNGFLFLLR
jgi:DNA-binding IclR family transcriptional regulator